MRSHPILLLSFALLIPTAAAAGFLGRPPQTPPDAPFAGSPPDFAGLPNLAGRVELGGRAPEHVFGFAPPFGGFDEVGSAPETPTSPTPEPSTVLLMLFGLAGMALRRRASA